MNIDRLRMRRVAVIATALGVLALMITGALDRVLLGVFVCAGLGLGWLNAQLTWKSVTHVIRSETASKQGLMLSTAVRLFGLTALAIVVAILARPNGIGIFFGLAVFHVIQVLHTVVPEWKGLRQTS
ncbi:hypothetical protein NDR87_25175 [Nocardia sp. CDC159]|uniref:ATP synthase subunit I n=1 Tax=Nocardia pulmonis TaxID=2951408 RepID=A0A9X2E6G2_9NOCA|nr:MULTISPECIES: hypothetical protein [Nocardia]MCM6775197.1 hypothetical protein [Nocardia pulmonis]MCM6789667.1 hypothetical protein [Nocardia sp. CDC159]